MASDPQFGIVASALPRPRSVPHWNCVPLHPPLAARYSVPPKPPWHSILRVAITGLPAKTASQGRSSVSIGAGECPNCNMGFIWHGFAVWLHMGLVPAVPMQARRSHQGPRRVARLAGSTLIKVAAPKFSKGRSESPLVARGRNPAPHAHKTPTEGHPPCRETGVERGEAPSRGSRGQSPWAGVLGAAPPTERPKGRALWRATPQTPSAAAVPAPPRGSGAAFSRSAQRSRRQGSPAGPAPCPPPSRRTAGFAVRRRSSAPGHTPG